jgi:hypothetical protein
MSNQVEMSVKRRYNASIIGSRKNGLSAAITQAHVGWFVLNASGAPEIRLVFFLLHRL